MAEEKAPFIDVPGQPANAAPGAKARAAQRSRSWIGERILSVFSEQMTDASCADAVDLLRRRRVLDVVLVPGKLTGKVYDELSQTHRVEIAFSKISDEKWKIVLAALAKNAYVLAMLLSGRLPQEIEAVFDEHRAELFPSVGTRATIVFDGKKNPPPNKYVTAVIYRFSERLDADPFSIFTLRGKGREETILELRRLRSENAKCLEFAAPVTAPESRTNAAPPLISTIDRFWTTGERLSELSYTIRADELPASILKWLDPLPLGGLEDQVEPRLEQLYEKVARLAQSFGLRL